ncbi:hypothetical protein [Nocardioides caricicola]|uniref:CopG family transcriptional regulator n=1 Tax=Nocardioides caricicola TaxID=634770 RepID=A0ABW0N0V9_9ACTN
MPKTKSDFPEQIVVRLTAEQMTFLRDISGMSGIKPSKLIRALIEQARVNQQVDDAIATIDTTLEEVCHAVGR